MCALESSGAKYLFMISTRRFLQLKRSITHTTIIVTVSELFSHTVEYDTGDVKGDRCVGVCVFESRSRVLVQRSGRFLVSNLDLPDGEFKFPNLTPSLSPSAPEPQPFVSFHLSSSPLVPSAFLKLGTGWFYINEQHMVWCNPYQA